MVERRAPPRSAGRTGPIGATFHALADPHRRAMLEALRAEPRTVTELAAPLPISLAAASKHLQVLARAGLVRTERDGRRKVCHLAAAPLADADAYLQRYRSFWNDRLDDLERALATDPGEDGRSRP